MRARAARVHDALGNAFVVKVRDLLAQDEIFQQRGPRGRGAQRVLVVCHRNALLRGQHRVFATGLLLQLTGVAAKVSDWVEEGGADGDFGAAPREVGFVPWALLKVGVSEKEQPPSLDPSALPGVGHSPMCASSCSGNGRWAPQRTPAGVCYACAHRVDCAGPFRLARSTFLPLPC